MWRHAKVYINADLRIPVHTSSVGRSSYLKNFRTFYNIANKLCIPAYLTENNNSHAFEIWGKFIFFLFLTTLFKKVSLFFFFGGGFILFVTSFLWVVVLFVTECDTGGRRASKNGHFRVTSFMNAPLASVLFKTQN